MLYGSYHRTETIEEALGHLAGAIGSERGKQVRLIAGGTDLMVQLRERLTEADALVDVSSIPALKKIWVESQRLHIGAAVTYSELIASELVNQHAYLLAETSRLIGGKQIQHMGTVGGNLGNASPAGDTLPCLSALEAEVTLTSLDGDRHVAMSDFMLGVRKTAVKPHELITKVSFNMLPQHAGSAFTKLGLRHSQAISVVDVATVLFINDGRISDARVALGSVAPTIVRVTAAEKMLRGEAPSDELFSRAAEISRKSLTPISDVRGSAAYRLYVAKPMVKLALETACERANTNKAD
jgi:carbon-monoxide dehydrogenase medium subunit